MQRSTTALQCAIERRHVQLVEMLINHGANVNALDLVSKHYVMKVNTSVLIIHNYNVIAAGKRSIREILFLHPIIVQLTEYHVSSEAEC